MIIYVNECDNDNIIKMQVSDKFMELVGGDDEGYSHYEKLANELRRIVEKKVNNPSEAYFSRRDAEECFDPFLCW